MIDPAIFNVHELVAVLLNTEGTPGNWWRRDCEFVTQERRGRQILVVRHTPTDRYLRHSKGPHQHHSWDVYGDDYMTPEWALLALSQAPAPGMLRADASSTLEDLRTRLADALADAERLRHGVDVEASPPLREMHLRRRR